MAKVRTATHGLTVAACLGDKQRGCQELAPNSRGGTKYHFSAQIYIAGAVNIMLIQHHGRANFYLL